MANQVLDVPPFPPLEWDNYYWTCEVLLSSWAGFQARRGGCASISSSSKSDGKVCLTVTTENDEPNPPIPEQIQAFRYLLKNENAVANSVLKSIFAEYPRLRELYSDDESDEGSNEVMPAIDRADQLRSMIGLSNVHVLEVVSRGQAYIGFEFGCTWDNEHGLGVMTHQDRVIKVGGADTSFLWWIADRDAMSKT